MGDSSSGEEDFLAEVKRASSAGGVGAVVVALALRERDLTISSEEENFFEGQAIVPLAVADAPPVEAVCLAPYPLDIPRLRDRRRYNILSRDAYMKLKQGEADYESAFKETQFGKCASLCLVEDK